MTTWVITAQISLYLEQYKATVRYEAFLHEEVNVMD
jgi:hypothetical protein